MDAALAAQAIEKIGSEVMFSLSHSGDRIRIAAGSTITGGFRASDSVTVKEIPGGRAAHLRLEGPYRHLSHAWWLLMAWAAEHGQEQASLHWCPTRTAAVRATAKHGRP
ncbi:hypothetical protein VQ02_07320 [Methylobacterium variabile]|uniref:GyrI-like small molecule binding domain-containing protein n=1 Tax=Methylobacterium variabile TaxID=298794 RepID=A0A0J6T4D9_9HYPH|nr:GyrI-like domain-containing protein [Methylobacterium variabile]KMO40642.1 hypothetical protein VQ02_07320 [Methylobacterium variabile]